MADITMCDDKECPKKMSCYRFMAVPNEYRQAYFLNTPRMNEDGVVTESCKQFWSIVE